jgi:hypothetical protein
VEKEAHHEAFGRLTAIRAAQAAAHASPEDRVDRIEIYGADGDLVYEADLKDITP